MLQLNVQTDFLSLLKDHIKLPSYIPHEFRKAFYKDTGRPRGVTVESFLWFAILQSLLKIDDTTLLFLVKICRELREFCEFESVPDASKFTLFRQNFVEYIAMVFNNFVDATEPICHALDPKKAGYLIYDPTGIEANVKENNPKFLNSKISQAKKAAAKNPEIKPHALAYSLMPESAEANPFAKQQYINGHFAYAFKSGIITNGLGIVRHIAVFDDNFKAAFPDVVSHKTDNPDIDKEISDSSSLQPVLLDFFSAHPHFWRTYHTFIGDASFDSYDNYTLLRDDFHFNRVCVPLNPRNSKSAHKNFDDNGTPLCPLDNTPFVFQGICCGKNRSKRFKFVCHKSKPISKAPACTCETPCSNKPYGRTVYTYPDKNFRLYPGIPRATLHFDNLYRHRVLIERTISLLKYTLGVASRNSFSIRTAKADLYIAGITHLIGVMLAVATNNVNLFKSIRKLMAA